MHLHWKTKAKNQRAQMAIYEQLANISSNVADLAVFQSQLSQDRYSELVEWVEDIQKCIELTQCKHCDGEGNAEGLDVKCAACAGLGVRIYISDPPLLIQLLSD